MFSDSHAHMVDYSSGQVKQIIELMGKNNVELVLGVGVNLESSEGTVKLAEQYSQIKAAIGFHPWFGAKIDDITQQRFEKLAGSKYVKAIGEVGLDYAPPGGQGGNPAQLTADMQRTSFPDKMPPLPKTPPSRDDQQEVFSFVISVAKKFHLPLNIHCRGGAHQDMMRLINAHPGLTGIAHSFDIDSNAVRSINDWLDSGFYIAIGVWCLREPDSIVSNIIQAIPLNSMVVETDANPRMSPEGSMGVIPVVKKIAEKKNKTPEEIGEITTKNLKSALRI